MSENVFVLSIPALRGADVAQMPALRRLTDGGDQAPLAASFPAVVSSVMANMLAGKPPAEHGVVGDACYDRQSRRILTGSELIAARCVPFVWDILHDFDGTLTSAAWAPDAAADWGADYFPTQSQTQSLSAMIESAQATASRHSPRFWFLHLFHLGDAAGQFGPSSERATAARRELDAALDQFIKSIEETYRQRHVLWLVASGPIVAPIQHTLYPNRILKQAGLLKAGHDGVDYPSSAAWAVVNRQFSHVYVREEDSLPTVVDLFQRQTGVAEILAGAERERYAMDHPHTGDVLLISTPDSRQSSLWEDDKIEEKTFGSYGAPVRHESQQGVLLSSERGVFVEQPAPDTDIADIVLRQFGI